MTRTQLITHLNQILGEENQLSTVVFAVMKETFEVKKLNIDNEEIAFIQKMFIQSIKDKIINTELKIK